MVSAGICAAMPFPEAFLAALSCNAGCALSDSSPEDAIGATGRDTSTVPAGKGAFPLPSGVLPAAAVPGCCPLQGKHSDSILTAIRAVSASTDLAAVCLKALPAEGSAARSRDLRAGTVSGKCSPAEGTKAGPDKESSAGSCWLWLSRLAADTCPGWEAPA